MQIDMFPEIKKEFEFIAYIDGSCKPTSPGDRMCIGIIVECKGTVVFEKAEVFEYEDNTADLSDYLALKRLIEWSEGREVLVYSNSTMLVRQMKGEIRIIQGAYKNTALWCRQNSSNLRFIWLPKEQNKRADRLSQMYKPITLTFEP